MELLREENTSTAWVAAIRTLAQAPGHKLSDLIVGIENPREEVPAIRAQADALNKRWSIETTANMVFPRTYAVNGPSPERLAERYARIQQRLRHTPANRLGTYFGQLVSYRSTPTAQPVNQLAIAVHNARTGRRMENVYDMIIQVPGYNSRPRGFHCLAYLNFKIEQGRLLLTAHYRNHWFIDRAYGNYLGLGRLQSYLAGQMDLRPGSLLCISGHAFIGGRLAEARQMLEALAA